MTWELPQRQLCVSIRGPVGPQKHDERTRMNDGTTTSSDYSQACEDWLRAKAERLGMRLIVHGDEGIYTLTRPLDEDNQDGDCETYHFGWAGPDGRVDPTTTYIDMDELEHALAPFETPGGLPF